MHLVSDLLKTKTRAPLWISPIASVFEALECMNKENIGALLVEVDGYLVGVVSERDYVRKIILNTHAAKNTKVAEIMTQNVITVTPEDTVVHSIALMRKHHIRHLPVVEEGKAVGIISLRDLFMDVIHEKFEEHNVEVKSD